MTLVQTLRDRKQQIMTHPLIGRLWTHIYLRKVLTLTAGTTAAQLIGIMAAPILTRIYSPEAFGIYGVFMGVISIGSVFATWRYERGLVVSGSRSEQHGLIALIVLLILLAIVISYLTGIMLPALLSPGSPMYIVFSNWSSLLAVGLGLTGLLLTLRFLALKLKAYRTISIAQVEDVTGTAAFQIGLGLLTGGAIIGLPLGSMMGTGLASIYLIWINRKNKWLDFKQFAPSLPRVFAAAKRNSIYPKYMTWSSLCNSAAPQAPIILLGFLFAPAALGQFVLAQRIVKMPFTFISQSMSQTNLQEGSETPPKEMKRIYLRRLRYFAMVGIAPFGTLLLLAPWLYSLVFGAEWRDAGILTQLLVPGLYIQFVFTPFTPFFTVLREQKVYLWWAVLRLALVSVGVLTGAMIGEVREAAIGYSIAIAFSFFLQHLLLLYILRQSSYQ